MLAAGLFAYTTIANCSSSSSNYFVVKRTMDSEVTILRMTIKELAGSFFRMLATKRESESKLHATVEGFLELTVFQVARCRYAQLNRNALRDTKLFERTGRVQTPSPTPCTESDRDALENSRESTRDARQSTECEGFSSHNSWEQGFYRPLSRQVDHVSSDTDVSLCQWAEPTCHSERSDSIVCPTKTPVTEVDVNATNSGNTPLKTDSGSTPSDSDSNFNFTDCESGSLPTSSEFEATEEKAEETNGEDRTLYSHFGSEGMRITRSTAAGRQQCPKGPQVISILKFTNYSL